MHGRRFEALSWRYELVARTGTVLNGYQFIRGERLRVL